MRSDRALNMIGMAKKAGAVKSGGFMTEGSIKEGSAYLTVVADDASDNTKKQFRNMCEFYKVPLRFYSDKETLGHSIGKEFCASLTVTNEGLAAGILGIIDQKDEVL